MDPVALILLVGIGGVAASIVSMRRMSGGELRGPRFADPRSVLVGGALILAAAAVAYAMVSGAMD